MVEGVPVLGVLVLQGDLQMIDYGHVFHVIYAAWMLARIARIGEVLMVRSTFNVTWTTGSHTTLFWH